MSLICDLATSFISLFLQQAIHGCSSTCSSEATGKYALDKSFCSGHGCCQVDVPQGITSYMAHFGGASNATGRHGHRGRPCSYLAIMAKVAVASFNHSGIWKTYNDMYRSGHVPAVMNWKAHRTGSCTEAQRNACSYPCISGNSVCVDSSVGQGYRCRCSKGYEGNPYVPNGCQGNI